MNTPRFVLMLFLLALTSAQPCHAGFSEQQVKSAYVLNFIKFVEWPPPAFRSPKDPILLYVVGKDPIGDSIDGLNGKTVSGRQVVVRKVPDLAPAASAAAD